MNIAYYIVISFLFILLFITLFFLFKKYINDLNIKRGLVIILIIIMFLTISYGVTAYFFRLTKPSESLENLFKVHENFKDTLNIQKEKYQQLKMNDKDNSNEEFMENIESLEKQKEEFLKKKSELEKKRDNQKNELNVLKEEYQKYINQNTYLIKGVSTFSQYPNYPNGCETVALYILLKYHGVNVNINELMERLPKGYGPYLDNGILYGADPEREFVGDPRDRHGYGVYQKPIVTLASYYKSGIHDMTGSSFSKVLEKVKSGHPVQVWVSINIEDTGPCTSWIDYKTGKTITWICNLHSVIVAGYTPTQVIVSDPYTGKIEYYARGQFEKMFNLFGKRALYYE